MDIALTTVDDEEEMGRSWTLEQLIFDGDDYFATLERELTQSRETIELETYIFDDDGIGRRVENGLAQAAARGVRVRLLVDGIGARAWIDRRAKELERKGVIIRIYHPVRVSNLARRLLNDLGLRRESPFASASAGRSALLSRLNRRDHRKLCIIDHRRAIVGSLNISEFHSPSAKGNQAWRDTAVLVEGEPIEDLLAAFDFVWLRSHTIEGKRRWTESFFPLKVRTKPRSPFVRLNYTHRLRRKHYQEFSRRLKRAQKRIWITNPYLAPSAPILRRLTKAAARGVDVRILVPRKSDVFFMPWVATAHYSPLLRAGVRIFEYLPRFLHAKSVIVDDWAVVGTSNLNRRSLLQDFEVDLVLSQQDSLMKLERHYLNDLGQSEEIRSARGVLSTWLGRFFSWILKNWI